MVDRAITGAIFDCDGTLLDALDTWRGLENVLADQVKVVVRPDERKLFTTFTIPETARYFHEQYGLGANTQAVVKIIDEYVMDYYANRAALMPGVGAFLESCASAGIRMSVASSSCPAYLQAGLRCAGVLDMFDHVLSVEDLETTKREPLIYLHAQKAMGTDLASTWGLEDSLYAMETLRGAQFPVIGIYDEEGGVSKEAASGAADVAVARLDELEVRQGMLVRKG